MRRRRYVTRAAHEESSIRTHRGQEGGLGRESWTLARFTRQVDELEGFAAVGQLDAPLELL